VPARGRGRPARRLGARDADRIASLPLGSSAEARYTAPIQQPCKSSGLVPCVRHKYGAVPLDQRNDWNSAPPTAPQPPPADGPGASPPGEANPSPPQVVQHGIEEARPVSLGRVMPQLLTDQPAESREHEAPILGWRHSCHGREAASGQRPSATDPARESPPARPPRPPETAATTPGPRGASRCRPDQRGSRGEGPGPGEAAATAWVSLVDGDSAQLASAPTFRRSAKRVRGRHAAGCR
jgi:hypothetical protein